MNIRERLDMLEPLIRRARGRALGGMVLTCMLCVMDVMSIVVLVMRWRVDQALENMDSTALPTRSLATLLAPPVLTVLVFAVGGWTLWNWSCWQGLRTQRSILETLAEDRDNT